MRASFATALALAAVVLSAAVPFAIEGRGTLPENALGRNVTLRVHFGRADGNGKVELSGKIDSIRDQENDLISSGVLAVRTLTPIADSDLELGLSKRNSYHYICDVGGDYGAYKSHIKIAVDYLKGLKQDCWVAAGPRHCGHLSCNEGATVWLCNDNNHDISYDCAGLTGMMDDVIDKCGNYLGEGQVRGQEFDDDLNYNVMLNGMPDCNY